MKRYYTVEYTVPEKNLQKASFKNKTKRTRFFFKKRLKIVSKKWYDITFQLCKFRGNRETAGIAGRQIADRQTDRQTAGTHTSDIRETDREETDRQQG